MNAKMMAIINGNIYLDISKKLFENYLNYYYRDIGFKNTAEINQSLVIETDNLSLLVSNIIHLIVNIIIVLLIYLYMFYIDLILTTLISVTILILAYLYRILLINKFTRMGNERLNAVNSYMKLIKSTFSNYKFVKSTSTNYINNDLQIKTSNYKRTRSEMIFWSEVPRLILEFIVIVLMLFILAFIKIKYEQADSLLFIVSVYALSLFRMLPSFSKIINSLNIINMYKSSLNTLHLDFDRRKEVSSTSAISFKNSIKLSNIIYKYDEDNVLSDLSFIINKYDKIAIVGESGSGKSTLLDILIGLHLPNFGDFTVDNTIIDNNNIVAWRQNASFVPQKVVLFESSIEENITFGKEYDEKLMKEVLEDVFMYDVVMSKGGLDTQIGDEVSGFSGGQMQRLALARALYQEKDILFLDEATSSLDEEVEILIIDNLLLKYKEKTIISIVHKDSVAKKFDRVIRIDNGNIIE
ncbi:ATP-binding cassette domain-containing protein [Aliarcobacter butzleri]|uniref:ATP-binding cassette domain-containing protein n=1 Tax=Aliarcobacter butzleri TaxID=28197 RepID=UPI003850BC11